MTVYHRTRSRRGGGGGLWDVQRQEIEGLWFNIGTVAEVHPRHWQAITGGRVVAVTETKRAATRAIIQRYEREIDASEAS